MKAKTIGITQLSKDELQIRVNGEHIIYITVDQLLVLIKQATEIVWYHYDLVPRG